jgi:hypothetical protein
MARAPRVAGALLVAASALASVVLARALDDPNAAELLQNGGFEDGTLPWIAAPGTAIAAAADVLDNDQAGAITIAASPGLVVQNVKLLPGSEYRLTGSYRSGSVPTARVRFRLRAELPDAPPFTASTDDLVDPDGSAWRDAEIISAPVPCEAISLQVQIVVTGMAGDVMFVDDLSLQPLGVAMPCPTETPTITPTATPTATGTATTTPPAAATATDTPSRTATATATGTRTPTSTPGATTATSTPLAPPPGELLVNGGFEAGLAGWDNVGGTLGAVDAPVRSGGLAGALFSNTTSTKWAYQIVAVAPTGWYQFDAYVLHNDAWVEGALLRISWYTSGDGSGSAFTSIDSALELAEPAPGFRLLSTGPVQAPPGVHSARARILLRPVGAIGATIYIDDASFHAATPPPAPTSTATTTPSPTRTPAATRTSTVTRTPSATPTPAENTIAAATSTPSPTAGAPATSTRTPPRAATRTPTATTAPEEEPAAPHSPPPGELLANGGFESGLTPWDNVGGTLAQVAAPVRSGAFAAALYSNTTATKWAYQTLVVAPTAWYQFDAHVLHDHPWVAAAFLRISWYESVDGSGPALTTSDSTTELTAPAPGFRLLSTGPVQAPPASRSAKARVLLRPRDATSALIYIDDASFRAVSAPAPPGEPAPEEPLASTSTSSASSGGTSGAGGRPIAPLATGPTPARAPMPTPVLRRSSVLGAEENGSEGTQERPWVAWLVGGGLFVAAVGSWHAYERASRRRLLRV